MLLRVKPYGRSGVSLNVLPSCSYNDSLPLITIVIALFTFKFYPDGRLRLILRCYYVIRTYNVKHLGNLALCVDMDNSHTLMLPNIPQTIRIPKPHGKFWTGTRYRREGHKILEPFSQQDFIQNMEHGKFVRPEHKAYAVLIYYSGVRELEGLRVTPENFTFTRTAIFFDVGKRLKHSESTPALKLPLKLAYMDLLKKRILETQKGERVFPFSAKTAYNLMWRAGFSYPHRCRLSRITSLFEQGWTVTQVRSWTGLRLETLNDYLGIVDTQRMGDKLT